MLNNASVAGERSVITWGRFSTDVAPYRPDYVHIMIGTNDIQQDNSLSRLNYVIGQMVANVRSIGAIPILGAIPPLESTRARSDGLIGQTAAARTHDWILSYAATNKITVIDYAKVVCDPENPLKWNPALTSDGIHPNSAGRLVMAEEAWRVLKKVVPRVYDPSNMLDPNVAYFGSDTNRDGLADGWSVLGKYPSDTFSLLPEEDGFIGGWQQISCSSPNASRSIGFTRITNDVAKSFPANAKLWSPGDRILFSCRLQTEGLGASDSANIGVRLRSNGVITYAVNDLRNNRSVPGGDIYTIEFVVPASADQLVPYISLVTGADSTGTARMRVAQFQMYNLTRLGLEEVDYRP